VKKAFLALDTDYDGYITVEDILKYFGTDKELNYDDLKKIMIDKDSKKQGKIGYSDFSKWLGSAIHMSEGFYYRHDSIKNPELESVIEKWNKTTMGADRKNAAQCLLRKPVSEIEYKIFEKIKFQWKTLRKAFLDMNIEKTGEISKNEFKFYLHFWGMDISDSDFNHCFNNFDLDRDGVISYKDF